MLIFLVAAAWLLAVGALAQNGLLVVLSAFALAGALGSSTGYWHASYGLLVRESTVTIVVFGLLGALASYLSMQVLQEPYARLARLFALMALLWVNFGFWVGSLWGDYPLEAWIAPDVMSPPYSKEAWDALQAWKAKALFISRTCTRWRGRWRWPASAPGARCTAGVAPSTWRPPSAASISTRNGSSDCGRRRRW